MEEQKDLDQPNSSLTEQTKPNGEEAPTSMGAPEPVKPTDPTEEPPIVLETTSLIEKADSVTTRMEAANKKAEELILRQEAIAARMLIRGKAEAGEPINSPKEEAQNKVDKEVEELMARYK